MAHYSSRTFLTIFASSLVAVLILSAPSVSAYPGYLEQFGIRYQSSQTDQASCATCHAQASGGSPWNAYGRDLLANGGQLGANGNITSVLQTVESLNSDAVAGNNLAEIQASAQPGWCETLTAGCNNQTYTANGTNAGAGIPPAGLQLDDGSSSNPEPNILAIPGAVDYGPTLIGQAKTLGVNLINTGQLDLTISAGTSGSNFAITAPPLALVTGGESTSVAITYTPQAETTDNDVLQITSNDPDTPILDIALSGTGTFVLPEPDGECPVGNQLIDPIPAPVAIGTKAVAFETIAEGFVNPLLGIAAPGDADRLFVADQPGQIWAVDLNTKTKSLFLDLSSRLVTLGLFGIDYDERGLLGAAFAPDYFTSGHLYTYLSEPPNQAADFTTMPAGVVPDHQSVIVEWTVRAPRSPLAVVDPTSARVIMRIDEPQFNHNGGSLVFGTDNMLYVTLGDGGGADDQGNDGDNIGHAEKGNGQTTANILGTIIRIDPNGTNAPNGQYGIPSDNPFVDPDQFVAGEVGGPAGCVDGICDEIYAYGFRNTWRASFDQGGTNAFIVADVGQNDIEEIDIIQAGGNYGWRIKDGGFCFDANDLQSGFVTDAEFAGPPNVIDPIAQYDHDEGISITGGFVYRGTALPGLQGHYVFGDWAPSFVEPLPGRLFYLSQSNLTGANGEDAGTIFEFMTPDSSNGVGTKINGFGQDANGEIYVIGSESGLLTGNTGKVQKLVPSSLPPGCS